MTVRDRIAEALERAVRGAGVEGELPDLELARTRNSTHGDFSTSAPLKLARVLRKPPDRIAAELAAAIDLPGGEAVAEAAGGYVNLRLSPSWLRQVVGAAAAAGPGWGGGDVGGGGRYRQRRAAADFDFADLQPVRIRVFSQLGDAPNDDARYDGTRLDRRDGKAELRERRRYGVRIERKLDVVAQPA